MDKFIRDTAVAELKMLNYYDHFEYADCENEAGGYVEFLKEVLADFQDDYALDKHIVYWSDALENLRRSEEITQVKAHIKNLKKLQRKIIAPKESKEFIKNLTLAVLILASFAFICLEV